MKFEIPEPKMPTPEEHREVSLQWLSRVRPTLMDQWPKDVMALSVPTKLIDIDVPRVWECMCELYDGKGVNTFLKGMALGLDHFIGWDRKFVRLSSRSPKDNIWPFAVPAVISGKEAMMMLMGSMRVMDDLMEFRWLPEQAAYIAVRDFDPRITPSYEFRCFVKEGKLIAVSHYDYTAPTPARIVKGAHDIRKSIDGFFEEKLKPALHIETVVFDLAMLADGSFILIEINPYGLSDPCHFGSYENVEKASSSIEMNEAAA